MQAPDMDVIKEIPGYKIIMKAVLKSQIQQLVEQLAETTGEESILLTASVTDGTLSHLGSENGKVFLDGHDEIKSQFLGFILKKHHRRKQVEKQFALGPGRKETFDTEQETVYSEASVHTELNPQVILEPILPPPPATKVHPVSIVRASSQIGPKGAASHAGPSKRGAAKKVQGAKEAQSADSDLGHLVKLEINNESEQSDSVPKAKSTPSATSKQSTQSSKDMPVLLDSAVSEQLNTTSGDLSYAEVSNIDSDFTSGAEASGLYSDIASGSKDMQLMENITIKLEADEMDYVPIGAEQSKADKDDPDWEPTAKKRRSSGSRSVASPGNKSVNVSGQGQTHTVKEELSEDEVEVEDVPTTSMPSNPEPDPELEYRPKTRKLVEKAEFMLSEGKNMCETCGKTFKIRSSLIRHRKGHGSGPEYICLVCSRKFYRRWELTRHTQTHTGIKFRCAECGSWYLTKSSLLQHEKTHNEPAFICPLCKKAFHRKYSLDIHVKTHSGLREFECEICKKRFCRKNVLKKHSCKPVTDIQCGVCNKMFTKRKYLKQHLLLHAEPSKLCSVCGKNFRWAASYEKHVKGCHIGSE